MKHSAYYLFLTYCLKYNIGDKETIVNKIAKWDSENRFYEGEVEELLALTEEAFKEDEESTK